MLTVECLCPTYGRPWMAANVAACFLKQDYAREYASSCTLMISDDAGQIECQSKDNIVVISYRDRFLSLPAKYDDLVSLSQADVLVLMDDDDVYLPWHVRAHVEALIANRSTAWSQPEIVRSDFTPELLANGESTAGRFHGSIAIRRSAVLALGGWCNVCELVPLPKDKEGRTFLDRHPEQSVHNRPDFDQAMIAALTRMYGPPARPPGDPSYIYRWHHGGQHWATDVPYRDRRIQDDSQNVVLIPQMDRQTQELYARFTNNEHP